MILDFSISSRNQEKLTKNKNKYQCIILNGTYTKSVTNNNKLFWVEPLNAFINAKVTVPKIQNKRMEEFIMTSSNNSSNRAVVPEAKGALDRFKFEVANELGVPLTDGYNGNLTSAQNGSVGGYMVKKMIEAQERQMAGK